MPKQYQCISLQKLIVEKSINEDRSLRKLVLYNEQKIQKNLNNLIKQNIKWHEFFFVNNLNYLGVTYEEVLEDSHKVCHSISEFCGVDIGDYKFSLQDSRYKKQSDNLNQELINKFYGNYRLNLTKQITSHELIFNNIKIV